MSNDTQDDINSLRSILFATMRGVKDGTIDIEKAKTVSDLGQVIINSAKVEVDAMRANGIEGSGFIPNALPAPAGQHSGTTRLHGKTIHKCL